MNKKAQGGIELSTSTIIKIVVAVLGLIVLWIIGANLAGIFVSDTAAATERNFERLASTIQNMDDGKEYTAYPLFIDADYVVVGYPTGANEIDGQCYYYGQESNRIILSQNKKPLRCKDTTQGCLCLCEKTSDIKDICQQEETIVSCKTTQDFGSDLSFVGGTQDTLSCPYAIVVGTDQSQEVYLKKEGDTVRLCLFSCEEYGESTASSTPTDIAAPSSESSVLIIGDSQSMGAYGDILYELFKKGGFITNKYAVCGATPKYFTDGLSINSASCNAEYVYNDGTSDSPTSGNTPLLDTLIKKHTPNILVVTFASNMYGSSEATIQSAIETFTDKIDTSTTACYWVGPPQGPRYEDRADYQQYKETIKENAEKGGCTFIDSEQYTDFPFCGDTSFSCNADVHFDSHGAEGKAAAKTWAEGVYNTIFALVG